MIQTICVQIAGQYRPTLPTECTNGQMVLTTCLKGYICQNGEWTEMGLGKEFIFLDLVGGSVFLVKTKDKCDPFEDLGKDACLIDYNHGIFYMYSSKKCRYVPVKYFFVSDTPILD